MKQAPFNDTLFFSGQGPLMIAKIGADGKPMGFRHVGNCTELSISPKTTSDDRKDSMTGARAIIKKMTVEVGTDIAFKLDSVMDNENLAMALRATFTEKAAGTVTDEAVTAYAGCILPLAHIALVDDNTLVVKSANGQTTYDKGDDYTVADNSLYIVPGGAIGTADEGDGIALKVSYGYGKQTHFQPLTEAAQEYALRFEGLNTADDNKAVVVNVYKVGTDVTKQFGMITDKAIPLEISGAALLDPTRTIGSKFFNIQVAN